MNLSRAKTILIYAFLGLNLFLCFFLFGDLFKKPLQMRVSHKQWHQIKEQVGESGYLVAARVDRAARKSAFLTVSPSDDPERAIRSRFEMIPGSSADPDGSLYFRGEEARLKVLPGGPLQLELTPGKPLSKEVAAVDEKAMAALVERYLKENKLVPAEIRYDHMTASGSKTVLHYRQTVGGASLFSGYLDAILENNTLMALEIYLLEPEPRARGREMEIIPAARALLRLVEILGPSSSPKRIIKVDPGFYSRQYDAEKWEVPPVWRFVFDNGDSCFINAFTGNLEPETSN